MSLSLSTKTLLAELFSTIAECENYVEIARKELADHDIFEPYAIFCRLGGFYEGEIDERDISTFCAHMAVPWSLEDAALLIAQYDENGNGKLSFHEFSSLVLPATNATLRSMAVSRDYSWGMVKTPYLEETLEHAVALVLSREIDYQRRVEDIRTELKFRKDFSSSAAFKMIDTGRPAHRIDRYEIRAFVNDHVRWLEEEDLDAIVRRCDTDGDELLVFSEFDDVVKNAKPVRTVPHLEETMKYVPAYGTKVIEEVHHYSSPGHLPVEEVVTHEITPFRHTTTVKSRSPARSRSPPRVVRTFTSAPAVEEYKFTPTRSAYYEPKAHSPPRLSSTKVSHHTCCRSPPRTQTTVYSSSRRGRSPLRGFEENELVESFKDLIALERELEVSKQALALRPDFTLNDAFKIFDLGMVGFITDQDIQATYEMYGVYITSEEARLILSRYDRDCDGILRFDEFIDLLLPKDLATSDALADRSALYPNGYYTNPIIPDPVTKNDFLHVLALNVKVENHAESIRQKHSERPLFNPIDAYEALNKFGDYTLNKGDFARLLADHRFFPTENELATLVDRFDKTRTGRVSYGDFVHEITPHSPERF